ncbi:MAG: hypothetical protein Q9P14_18020 [candidate division KSB1 bacterium]|nr:hypothetical protein [candidate division KSB1 bacterium]
METGSQQRHEWQRKELEPDRPAAYIIAHIVRRHAPQTNGVAEFAIDTLRG